MKYYWFSALAIVLSYSTMLARAIAVDIEISSSGHYFTYKGQTRMILTDSGTHTVMQNLNLDYRAWVDALAAEGQSGAHIWAVVPPRQQLDETVMESRWGYVYPGITPWARKTSGANAFDGGKQWNLLAFDEGTDPNLHYWPRLRDLCARLKKKEMMLGITVFFGWPKDIPNDLNYHPFFNLNGGPAQTRQDITFIDSPGTEVNGEAWNDSWVVRKKTQWLWEMFALKLIQETQACGNVWFDFRDEWSYDNNTNTEEHFRNFFMSRGQIWADRSEAASFRVANENVPSYGLTPAMKTEGGPYDHEGVRRETWDRAMSGIHYLLHNDSRVPGIMAWDKTTAGIKNTNPADDTGRKYVGIASRFFNENVLVLDTMEPHNEIVSTGKCLATLGSEYVVNLESGGTVTMDLSPVSGILAVSWFSPVTGQVMTGGTTSGGGPKSFTTPDSRHWVLHLSSKSVDAIAPDHAR